MPLRDHEIKHVSDTALMVAACRALESETEDGFVRDPYAARLAGDRGMAILRALPQAGTMQFGIGVRSRFIDELLLEALAVKPVATVLSVGCGLDTRPWRLELPRNLRWIEVDFADMLAYKDAMLSGEAPRCRRQRLTADVNDATQRRALYAAAGEGPALMITEGLLMYLPAAAVDAFAAEASQESRIGDWITDITTAAFQRAVQSDTDPSIRNVQASDALEGQEIFDTLRRRGWDSAARRSYITDMGFAADRIRRVFGEPPPAQGAAPAPPPTDEPSGVHRMEKAANQR